MKLLKFKYFNNFLFTTFILNCKVYKIPPSLIALKKLSLIKLYVFRKFTLLYNLYNYLRVIKKELILIFKHISNQNLLNHINNIQFFNLQFKSLKYLNCNFPIVFNFLPKTLIKNYNNNVLYDYNLHYLKNNQFSLVFRFSVNKSFQVLYMFLKSLVYRVLKQNYQCRQKNNTYLCFLKNLISTNLCLKNS